jgi:hypothetical protein
MPENRETLSDRLARTPLFKVYICSDCAFVEGGRAQAGCCRECGSRNEPDELVVVVQDAYDRLRAENERLREALSRAREDVEFAARTARKRGDLNQARVHDATLVRTALGIDEDGAS